MSAKTKSVFVLLGILVLGLIMGVMLQTTIHNRQMERVRSLRDRGTLSTQIESVVKPQSEEQREAIKSIVDSHEEMMQDVWNESRRALSAVLDSMQAKLVASGLTAEQAAALDKWRTNNRSRNRRRSGSRREEGSRGQ